MSINIQNNGFAIGRLTRDPKVFPNSDGSKKVLFTIAVPRNYKNSANERDSDFLPMEAFIPAARADLGVYGYMHKGDKVAIAYAVQSSTYTDKNTGAPVYKIGLNVQEVSLQESKATTAARAATAAAQAAALAQGAAEAAGVPAPEMTGEGIVEGAMPEGEQNPFGPC